MIDFLSKFSWFSKTLLIEGGPFKPPWVLHSLYVWEKQAEVLKSWKTYIVLKELSWLTGCSTSYRNVISVGRSQDFYVLDPDQFKIQTSLCGQKHFPVWFSLPMISLEYRCPQPGRNSNVNVHTGIHKNV